MAKWETNVSRALSRVLRHTAEKDGLKVLSDGFVLLTEVLSVPIVARIKPAPTIDDIRRIVLSNDKQRFALKTDDDGALWIRANQGHSLASVETDELLRELTLDDVKKLPAACHGTYTSAWAEIEKHGLSRMSRRHIHIASEPLGSKHTISGTRSNVQVLIHLNLAAAMQGPEHIRFFMSDNNVILTEGDLNGFIPPKYFARVEHLYKPSSAAVNPAANNANDAKTMEAKSEVVEKKNEKKVANGYLMVLDFEATCEEGKKFGPQEIIEFPIVVLDAVTGEVLCQFHEYVRPVVNPKLTDFCTKLTGIQQSTVDAAEPFPAVWKRANEFLLRELKLTGAGGNAVFVTCGDWDLKQMLPAQLKVSGIGKTSSIWRRWINIKQIFSDHYKIPKAGMVGMLAHLKIELKGRHHSGIDDSHNIARILQSLIKANAQIHL